MDNLLNQSESSKTREKEVSESEEQNDNVSGDEINEEQDIKPNWTVSGQTLYLPKNLYLPEVRKVITHSKPLRGSQVDLHDHAQVKLF